MLFANGDSKRPHLILYYLVSLLFSFPSFATEASLPENFSPDTIAAVGMEKKGFLLETHEEGEEKINFVVGVTFKYLLPACSPKLIQKISQVSNEEIPIDYNPNAKSTIIETSIDLKPVLQAEGGQTVDCKVMKASKQMIKVSLQGNKKQSLYGNIINIPMVPPGKSSDEKRWMKVLVLYNPIKHKIGASVLEDLPKGYLAAYLKLAVLEGKL